MKSKQPPKRPALPTAPEAPSYQPDQAASLHTVGAYLLTTHASSAGAGGRLLLAQAALKNDKEFATDPEAPSRLEPALGDALGRLVAAVARRLPTHPADPATPLSALGAPEDATPTLAEQAYVEVARSLDGPSGANLATKVEAGWLSKLAQFQRGETPLLTLWQPWLLDETTGQVRRYVSLATAVWFDLVRQDFLRERESKPLKVAAIRRSEQTYAKLPKVVPALSWAMGGDGIPAKSVMLGMERYVAEPSLLSSATFVPKTWRLLPDQRASKPHQTSLPLDPRSTPTPPPAAASAQSPLADILPVAVVGSTGQVMSPSASKLALLALASEEVIAGKLAKATLAELTQAIRPDLSRIQARDHEATGRGLDELRQLFLFLPDGGRVQLFDVTSPANPAAARPEMTVYYGVTKGLEMTLLRAFAGEFRGPQLRGQEYRGSFLMNLSGAMRLPNNQPSLLRYYVRLAAAWNAAFSDNSGTFDMARFKALPLEEWAALANSLQAGTVDYLAAKQAGQETTDRRRQLSMERKRAREDLEALAEEHKLIQLEGKGNLVRPLPPSDYLEAWELFRQQGGRPTSPFPDDE